MLPAALLCLVVAITDGDTIKAKCGHPGAYEQVTIRISAIDAPEKRQAFGEVSRQHLAKLCFQTQATITPRAKDRYGRTVGDAECRGQDAGQAQVQAGMAWVYTKYAVGRTDLKSLESTAKAEGRGLWADWEPVAPWEWRRAQRERRDLVDPGASL